MTGPVGAETSINAPQVKDRREITSAILDCGSSRTLGSQGNTLLSNRKTVYTKQNRGVEVGLGAEGEAVPLADPFEAMF